MNNHIVIMAGGIGSRLWPLSTPEFPKQFIDVLGIGKSLLQLTVERFLPICPIEHFWVVTSGEYVDIVRTQLPDLPEEHIIAEPVARGTAPCIAYASWKIASKYPSANIVVTPADALVLEKKLFAQLIKEALEFSAKSKSIVTLGIRPTRPETGYGYIRTHEAVEGKVIKVDAFVEKPNLEKAKEYLQEGNYVWNAGIFIWKASTIKEQLEKYSPQIVGVMEELAPHFFTSSEEQQAKILFPKCDKISIDYAVMEKSKDIYVITGDLGWSDLGSWTSIRDNIESDTCGNSVVGENVSLYDCKNCVVHTGDIKRTIVEGLDGYIVASRGDELLVCSLDCEQDIKDFLEKN